MILKARWLSLLWSPESQFTQLLLYKGLRAIPATLDAARLCLPRVGSAPSSPQTNRPNRNAKCALGQVVPVTAPRQHCNSSLFALPAGVFSKPKPPMSSRLRRANPRSTDTAVYRLRILSSFLQTAGSVGILTGEITHRSPAG